MVVGSWHTRKYSFNSENLVQKYYIWIFFLCSFAVYAIYRCHENRQSQNGVTKVKNKKERKKKNQQSTGRPQREGSYACMPHNSHPSQDVKNNTGGCLPGTRVECVRLHKQEGPFGEFLEQKLQEVPTELRFRWIIHEKYHSLELKLRSPTRSSTIKRHHPVRKCKRKLDRGKKRKMDLN